MLSVSGPADYFKFFSLSSLWFYCLIVQVLIFFFPQKGTPLSIKAGEWRVLGGGPMMDECWRIDGNLDRTSVTRNHLNCTTIGPRRNLSLLFLTPTSWYSLLVIDGNPWLDDGDGCFDDTMIGRIRRQTKAKIKTVNHFPVHPLVYLKSLDGAIKRLGRLRLSLYRYHRS